MHANEKYRHSYFHQVDLSFGFYPNSLKMMPSEYVGNIVRKYGQHGRVRLNFIAYKLFKS